MNIKKIIKALQVEVGSIKVTVDEQAIVIKQQSIQINNLKMTVEQQAIEIIELRAENAELRAENAELRAENAELRAEIISLKAELSQVWDYCYKLEERVSVLEEWKTSVVGGLKKLFVGDLRQARESLLSDYEVSITELSSVELVKPNITH